MFRPLAALAVALLAAPAPADDALLAAAREANRASVAAIGSWSGAVDFRSKEVPDPGRATGTYLRAGDQVRATVTRRGEETFVVRTAAGQRTLVLDPAEPGDVTNYGEAQPKPVALPPGDPWACGLLAFPAGDGPVLLPLDAWLSGKGVKVLGAERAAHAGRPVVRVKAVAAGGFEHEFDLDPAAGHLVCVHRVRNDSPPRRDAPPLPMAAVAEVTAFQAVKPGVFVPVAATSAGAGAGRPTGYEWAATGVTVNEPVPADAWELKFPAGLRVVDFVTGGVFRTDADGRPGEWARTPAGQPYAYLGRVPPEVAAAAAPPPATAAAYDPMVVWPVAVVAVVVLLAVGGLVVYARRRK